MSDQSPPLFAICPMGSIAVGEAKAFDLARLDDEGTAKPFRIVVVRKDGTRYLGYVNTCPHEGVWLNIGRGAFFDPAGTHLQCGKHRARFDIETGVCVSGPCEGQRLEAVEVVAASGDICISGIRLLEDDGVSMESDDTMEIMIHPE